MADGRHFEHRYIAISREKSSDFHEILYTAADFELDERNVIKNEKVALNRCDRTYFLFFIIFTARRVCIARTIPSKMPVCPSVCSSVCPSHAGIVCKRLYISSEFFLPSGSPPF